MAVIFLNIIPYIAQVIVLQHPHHTRSTAKQRGISPHPPSLKRNRRQEIQPHYKADVLHPPVYQNDTDAYRCPKPVSFFHFPGIFPKIIFCRAAQKYHQLGSQHQNRIKHERMILNASRHIPLKQKENRPCTAAARTVKPSK